MKKYLIVLFACLFLATLFAFFIIKNDWHKNYTYKLHLKNNYRGDTTRVILDSVSVQDSTIKNKPIYLVTNKTCYVYQAPASDCQKIAELRKGTLLLKIGEEDKWHHVQMSNQRKGWLKDKVVDMNPMVLMTLERSNIRSGPGTNFSIKFVINKGTLLVKISQQSGWLEIYLSDGEKGWIKDDLVKDASALMVYYEKKNIRFGPSTSYVIKSEWNDTITILEVIEQKSDLYKVKFQNGKTEWIKKDLVSFSFPPIQNYDAANKLAIPKLANLRVRPDINAEIIRVMPPKTSVWKLSEFGDWAEVQTEQGVIGWIFIGITSTLGSVNDRDDWVNMRLPNGMKGWIHQDLVTPIESSINQTLDHLKSANISFNSPETMKVAETKTIILLMSQEKSILQLADEVNKQISEPGKIYGDTAKTSAIMEASLTGQGFLINAITPVRQRVHGFDINTWKWEVTAKETGERKLHLTLNALISYGKDQELHTIKTYERTVLVYVRFGDKILAFLGDNWQFLFGAIVSPLAIYVWKRFLGRKQIISITHKRKAN